MQPSNVSALVITNPVGISSCQENNLWLYVKRADGFEVLIEKATGKAFTTQRGYARMGNVSEGTVRYPIKAATQSTPS